MHIRLFGQQIPMSIAVLAALEGLCFYLILISAGMMRFHFDVGALEHAREPLWQSGLMFSGTMFACVLAVGLYSSRQRARCIGILVRAAVAVMAGIAVTAGAFLVIPGMSIGYGALAMVAAATVALILAFRLGIARLLGESAFRRRVLVYGAGRSADAIAQLRRRTDQRGYMLVGFMQAAGEELSVPSERLLGSDADLLGVSLRHSVDEIVVAMDDRRREFPIRGLLDCRLAGIDVTELLTFLERETGRVIIDVLNPSWLIFGAGYKRGSWRLLTARVVDFIASLVILLLASPIIVATAVAIKLEEGWRAPVLYRQERVGFRGRVFKLLKFRSMRINAEVEGQAVWAQKNDPRVTRVGGIIRKLRIDELPQIINVLRGEMGLVGPRPERPQFVEQLAEKIPYYIERHSVKPGITGWAQLCYPYGSSEQDAIEKLKYDLFYIKNTNLLFDLSILAQTVEVVVFGKGAR